MKYTKIWNRVGPMPLTANGTAGGIATVASTFGFYKNQQVIVKGTALPDKLLEVKRVLSRTELLLGPRDGSDTNFSAINLYTTAASSTIEAPEQSYGITPDEAYILASSFESQPASALRNVLVDSFGDFYTTSNPLPVRLSDGSVNIETLNAELEVQLKHTGSDYDSIRLGDGVDLMAINADGSINTTPVGVTTGIDLAHKKCHDGKFFTHGSVHLNLNDDAELNHLIKVGAGEAHVSFAVTVQGDYLLALYEAPTTTVDGSSASVFNNNRNSVITNTVTLFEGPTVTVNGTLLFETLISGGSGGNSIGGSDGSPVRLGTEIILKPNTNYLLKVTNKSGQQREFTAVSLGWYEV